MELRQKRLLGIAIAAFAISAIGGVGIWQQGIAADCKPGQVDGQCGLSSAMGTLFGIGFFLGVNLVMAIIMLVLHLRWKSARALPAK